MDPKILLLRKLDELHQLINSSDDYDVLKASATIRQLFLDGGNSLVDKVNRTYQRKYKFNIVQYRLPLISSIPMPDIWCCLDSIDPRNTSTKLPSVSIKRAQFFSTILGFVHGNEYTISDLIKYVANVMGGVHSGEAIHSADEALEILSKIYLFPNLNIPLLHIRSVGRIILETLRGTKEDILGVSEFVGCLGFSIHMAIRLQPMKDKRENFLLDLGVDLEKNRISIFLNQDDLLPLRLIDNDGNHYLAQAGKSDHAYHFNELVHLVFNIAVKEDKAMLMIESGGWNFIKIVNSAEINIGPESFNFVLGSSVNGAEETSMDLMEHCIYNAFPPEDDRKTLNHYFANQITNGYTGFVKFRGNKFMYSKDHPNFEINS